MSHFLYTRGTEKRKSGEEEMLRGDVRGQNRRFGNLETGRSSAMNDSNSGRWS